MNWFLRPFLGPHDQPNWVDRIGDLLILFWVTVAILSLFSFIAGSMKPVTTERTMLNRVDIIGHLGADPELRYTQGGAPVCNFNVATTERWTKDGQTQEKTEWHKIVVWGKLAEVCEKYLKKGRQAYISGRLQTREWEDKDGNKRYTTEINAQTVQFLGSKDGGGGAGSGANSAPDSNFDQSFNDDDIPF